MGYTAKLIYGSREFNLNSGPYSLWGDFIPPATVRAVNLAPGTFRNKNGGQVAGTQPKDRSWAFGVLVEGASEAECRLAARNLQAFLNIGIDPATGKRKGKLYFEFDPSDAVPYRPLWGQSVYRYEIKHGTAAIWDMYPVASLREKAMVCPLDLLIGPEADGLNQAWGSAAGGVFEDTIGAVNGFSRGINIPPAAVNEFTNPVFGHATYDNGWTAQANITVTKNTDRRFIMFGGASAKIVCAASGNSSYYQTLNLGAASHILSFFAKKPDGSAVSAADIRPRYVNTIYDDATYQAVGDGWYRVIKTLSGEAADRIVGVTIQTVGVTVYVDGFHVHENSFVNAACNGDMLGNAWGGTAHASATTRTAGRLRFTGTDFYRPNEGSIRFAWKAPVGNTTYGGTVYLLSDSAASEYLQFLFLGASNQFRFRADGTNNCTSSAVTFAAGALYVFHLVWGPSGQVLYVNGTASGSNATFAPAAAQTYVYLGSKNDATTHAGGVYSALCTWDRALSSSQVAADYGNVEDWLSGGDGYGQALDPIPWLWTKDGDMVVDNCDDSTRDNWCVVGGVPGTAQARTIWKLNPSATFTKSLWLGNHIDALDDWLRPTSRWYVDGQGTADASCSGGEYEATALNAGPDLEITPARPDSIHGQFHFFLRAALQAGGGVPTAEAIAYIKHNQGVISTEIRYPSLGEGVEDLYYLGRLDFDPPREILDAGALALTLGVRMAAVTALQMYMDFLLVMNGPMFRVDIVSNDFPLGGVSPVAPNLVRVDGKIAYLDSTAVGYAAVLYGEEVSVSPGVYNTVFTQFALYGGPHVITDTVDFSGSSIIPRWVLL